MKSEERHHLEQNELAGWVMRTVGATRRYSVLIVGAIVVVAAISIFTSVYSSSSQRYLITGESEDEEKPVLISAPPSPKIC